MDANMSSISPTTVGSLMPDSPKVHSYISVVPEIWSRLKRSISDTDKAATYDKLQEVVSIFHFAQVNRPATGFGGTDEHEQRYRAELNTWCYYFHEPASFPGTPPPPHLPEIRMNSRAITTKSELINMLAMQKDFGLDYEPQMGWNPSTGEPWLAFRCSARNAYPAISGPYNRHARDVEKCVPEFTVKYQRYKREQYVLVWPEFASTRNFSSPTAWERFARFRAFLEDWATGPGDLEHINDACRRWAEIPLSRRRVAKLPEGFKLDMAKYASDSVVCVDSSQGMKEHRSQQHHSRQYSDRTHERQPQEVKNHESIGRKNAVADVDSPRENFAVKPPFKDTRGDRDDRGRRDEDNQARHRNAVTSMAKSYHREQYRSRSASPTRVNDRDTKTTTPQTRNYNPWSRRQEARDRKKIPNSHYQEQGYDRNPCDRT